MGCGHSRGPLVGSKGHEQQWKQRHLKFRPEGVVAYNDHDRLHLRNLLADELVTSKYWEMADRDTASRLAMRCWLQIDRYRRESDEDSRKNLAKYIIEEYIESDVPPFDYNPKAVYDQSNIQMSFYQKKVKTIRLLKLHRAAVSMVVIVLFWYCSAVACWCSNHSFRSCSSD